MSYYFVIQESLYFETEEEANRFMIEFGDIGQNPFHNNVVIEEFDGLWYLDLDDYYCQIGDYHKWLRELTKYNISGDLILFGDEREDIRKAEFINGVLTTFHSEIIYNIVPLDHF